MIFTSFEFLLFFLTVLGARALCRGLTAEKWVMLVASYLFYASWSVPNLGLLFAVSAVDFWIGRTLARLQVQRSRRLLVVASVTMNLGLLGYFKYTNWALENIGAMMRAFGWNVHPAHLDLVLPVGVSFFTFQSMSYILDVYRREIPPCESLRDFLLFVSFFPQLVAGPIVRASVYLPQLLARQRATSSEVESGVAQFLLGAVKKAVLSDQVSGHVDQVFSNPANYDSPTLLLGLLGYALQIYCDFSGYSDMAIGTARIMGYKFLENFRMPYASINITEFWRRWHISLSTWLRDYLYIPLGGNRKGAGRTYFNLLATMVLGGIWHGAGWNFVIWGAIHGGAMAIHRLWMATRYGKATISAPPLRFLATWTSRGLTLGVVLVGWIFFRAQGFDAAWEYLRGLAGGHPQGLRNLSPQTIAALAGVVLVHFCIRKDSDWCLEIVDRSPWARFVAYTTLLTLLVNLAVTDAAPFIYFQF